MAEKKKTREKKKPTRKKKAVGKREKKEKLVKPVEVPPVEAKEKIPAKEVEVKKAAPPAEVAEVKKAKKEKLPAGPKYYGTGRRKEAVARVWLRPGNGNILLNGKSPSDYFCGRKLLEYQVVRPLAVTNTQGSYDVYVEAFGGGVPGQAGAVSLGIARALLEVNPDFRVKLKREGLLRRDPRMKERKKYGLKRARRAFQYTKR